MYIPWYDEDELNIEYKNCIVTYIDIMGFRRQVEESVSQPGVRDGILHSLREINAAVNDRSIFHVDDDEAHLEPFEVRSFSDLVVRFRPLSEKTNQEFAIFREILDLCFAQARLLQHGTLVRGGMTMGKLYFDDTHVFGPGLVRAYELESRHSVYPRIITEFHVARDFSRNWSGSPLVDEDSDGTPFISYLSPSTFTMFDGIDFTALDHVRSVITWSLEETQSKVAPDRQKLLWVSRKYNQLIEQLEKAGKTDRERLASFKINPEHYAKSNV